MAWCCRRAVLHFVSENLISPGLLYSRRDGLCECSWGKPKVFSEHLAAAWEGSLEGYPSAQYLTAMLRLDWWSLNTKSCISNVVDLLEQSEMHQNVAINGLWCSSKLVQSLGWYTMCSASLGTLHAGCALELCFTEVLLSLILSAADELCGSGL